MTFKGTRTGLVVQRLVQLFRDRCTTYHDASSKSDTRTWLLDRNCEVKPATSAELTAKKRGVRPKGKWAITAAVQGVDTYVDLYEMTIDWPASWAASGYTTLDLGFTDLQEAVQWHDALLEVLAGLGAKAKGSSGRGLTSKLRSPTEGSLATSSVPVGASARSASMAVTASSASVAGAGQSMTLAQATSTAASQFATAASTAAAAAGLADDGEGEVETWEEPVSDEEGVASSDGDEDDGASEEAGPDGVRWVPYRQTNGVAIYHHVGEDKASGGEYMVSCAIRGRPQRVAAALLRLRNNTTLLGPAEHAEILEPAEQAEIGVGREVLRLVLTASGVAGFFCAPREIILERMRKDEEDGVIVVMFKSVDLPNETSSKAGGNLYGKGLYRKPVRGSVAGGYTIAGLKGEGAASKESLVTCIIKLDLGGVCGSGSWARPLSSLAGWTDSFLDRILMSVNLLRDEVEQRRFSVQPFKMVASAKARFNAEGALVGASKLTSYISISGPSGVGALPAASGSGSGSFLGRPTARMASLRTGSASTAAAAAVATEAAQRVHGVSTITEESSADARQQAAEGGLVLDLAHIQSLASMPRKYWSEVHVPGSDAPFNVRGPTYLKDGRKVPAGAPAFRLGAVEMIVLPPLGTPVGGAAKGTPGVVQHVSRFIPSIRQGGAPFSIIIHLVVPGSPMLGLVSVFCCEKHPSILGSPPQNPMEESHDWQAFDFVLHKFVYGSDETRNKMLKLIPHIASGSWMIKQSVGSTPVILGKALKTTYHCTPTYIEVDIDISANKVANYVTGMVRGATASLAVDLGFVLEGTAPWELPECLLGCFRLSQLDCAAASVELDWAQELPLNAGPAAAK